ncbi:MAG: CDGSH iron-sulfur domain-containing protein [Chitinophagales bacterium]
MEELEHEKKQGAIVELRPNGPIVISGIFEVTDEQGNVMEKKEKRSFCRCGLSKTYPICDGAHKAMAS